jgi:chromosome segregation ATPase
MIARQNAENKSLQAMNVRFREENSKLNQDLKDLQEKTPTTDEQIKKLQADLEKETKAKNESYGEMETIFMQNEEWEEKHKSLIDRLEGQKQK